MEQDFPKTTFYDAMMTSVFVGFFATIICLAYDLVFRSETGYPLTSLINVSTIIFSVMLIFLVIGVIYYGLIAAFKKADIVFILLFLLLAVLFSWMTGTVHRSDNPEFNTEFKDLLLGIIIIAGAACVCIPLLYHNKKFREMVL
jgi:positive regulator of sigma E activity